MIHHSDVSGEKDMRRRRRKHEEDPFLYSLYNKVGCENASSQNCRNDGQISSVRLNWTVFISEELKLTFDSHLTFSAQAGKKEP